MDVLHVDNSQVVLGTRGDISSVKEFVFCQNKLKDIPDLFRTKHQPFSYFVSEKVVSWCKEDGCTNICLLEVENSE